METANTVKLRLPMAPESMPLSLHLQTQTNRESFMHQQPCPLGGGVSCVDVVALRDLPVNIGRLWPDRASALAAPRGDVVLAFCPTCGFVFNSAFDPETIAYEPGYEFSLHHSPSHREFLEQTADRLVAQYDLRDKDIVEVGCGGGFFLQLLCERGGNRGWGFDPAIDEQRTLNCGDGQVTLIPGFYDESQHDIPCDLLVSRSMFELIHDPIAFLQSMRRALGGRTGARFYLDIPNSSYVFRRRALWNLFYEQCNYFVDATLRDAFGIAGFDVLGSGECLGDGYYLFVEAAPASNAVAHRRESQLDVPTELLAMAKHLQSQRALWNQRLNSWRDLGKCVVAWGSGGRAINFLNMIDGADWISHIVDINPARRGGFVSGSGQQIIAPVELPALRPDVVVITNSLYRQEIREHVAALGLDCDFAEI